MLREYLGIIPGKGSAKIRRLHSRLSQKKRRALIPSLTGHWLQGGPQECGHIYYELLEKTDHTKDNGLQNFWEQDE